MSGLGQTRKYPRPDGMSVLPSGADIVRPAQLVRSVPTEPDGPSAANGQVIADRPCARREDCQDGWWGGVMTCNAIDGLQQAGFPEYLFDLIGEVLPDLVLALIDSLPGNFIAPAHEPVIVTQHSVVRFRFIPELFNQEVRAALRAFRLNNDIGNTGHSVTLS
jgi:hypothetical protein